MSKRTTEAVEEASAKKLNTQFTKEDTHSFFNPAIFDEQFRADLKTSVLASQPYKWGTIKSLLDDTLLRQVRKEVENEIVFTKKETDIYKVHQSGDLANLSGLDWDDLSRLPSLFKMRAAIYSEEFRDYLSELTGCGKLSGVKTDMSINTYTKSCHLLTHDDVIGSRRVSFILYLPDADKTWKEHYGGALRLFPSVIPNVPQTDYHCKLVPQFNQIAFFTVQPGLSFHDVEEVRVNKQRLSIQGWFHIPQEGEDGYIPGEQEATEARSSLQQLQSKELAEFDFPKPIRTGFPVDELRVYELVSEVFPGLAKAEHEYLAEFMNPTLLDLSQIHQMHSVFSEESVIEIPELLNPEFAGLLYEAIRTLEMEAKMPQTAAEIQYPWKCAVPPHKHRYMYLDGRQPEDVTTSAGTQRAIVGPQDAPNFALTQYIAQSAAPRDDAHVTVQLARVGAMFQSLAFRKWVAAVTGLAILSDQVLVRRFRPGHDFTLATKLPATDALLEASLNLTPSKGWDSGELGGYELCMAGMDDEDEDDPAIYKAAKVGEDGGDDGVLFTSQAKWNSLTLMLRDESVLKFVKYVSWSSQGSRWDLSCQWGLKEEEEAD
ncbi:hypothetical protein BABINDRAFT_7914 [Babjeviella inositovora NRRL Y-12698]|uniref:uS12 prolyl 3,4-dihydroxylase n=1 Tax=Babjeviella inositovora NRRL Y-12698 TaxID=984486 RepID=A0A1E3QRY0_9ASCO|nr:uncharacterized protein BABINDRAFT_7914 [Babjeviella inositovora NRRL Y-12698]ODQ79697.1 hypothetical protein BABINDRAFT_7914 [Babjeviella inositovora NRRL Y-12698]